MSPRVILYNTLTRKKEIFKPLRKDWVGLYTCGPTVYNYVHIGNLRTYIFEDVLRRMLEHAGYKVKHVMNTTDVGHLTSDADTGEDKMEKGAKESGKTVWEIAQFYTKAFFNDAARLNIKKAHTLAPATKYIKEQRTLIQKLFKRGFAYDTPAAIYFDVSKFKNYTKLSRQKLSEKIVGARDEVIEDPYKKHPYDFALWFKLFGRYKDHTMRWPSPWGKGFPGWHIECSAISTKNLGQPFDIHTGGVDHINVHHTNEIAQSEGAFGKPLARIWMHGEFLIINQERMGKSIGNFVTLDTLVKKGFSSLAFRYLVLTSHYRSQLNFTWESIAASQKSLERLYEFVKELKTRNYESGIRNYGIDGYKRRFDRAILNDLDTSQALAVVWTLTRDYHKKPDAFSPKEVLALLYDFDRMLGLRLKEVRPEKIPSAVLALAKKRDTYRAAKDWQSADRIRREIEKTGYLVKDTPQGPHITLKN